MALETYRQKRNFRRTSEPRGRKTPAQRSNGRSFVVQKHDARSLHYDFRLELGGVMLSWAVPKGPSLDPKVKRLAMQTEDHPIEYSDFEGIIPEGEYGGGTVLVWDRGSWKPEGDPEEMYRRGRLNFELEGQKLHGSFHLVRTPSTGRSKGKASDRKWLLFKSNDAAARPGSGGELLESQPLSVASGRDIEQIAADPDHVWTSKPAHNVAKARRAVRASAAAPAAVPPLDERPGVQRARLPAFVEPQLATLSAEAPEGQDWLHEIKLDGYRVQARIEQGRAQLLTRRGNDWSSRLPSIASALGALPAESALLDGELVVLREDGISDFQLLQNSLEAGKDGNCVYFAFDALFLDGFDLRQLPLSERKALLRSRIERASNSRVRFGDHIQGTGPAFFQQACRRGLEGIVCKRAAAPYSSGRGRGWLKVKCLSVQEFVVGGFTEPAGSRSHLGALLVGVREGKALRYAGKVGTGFTQASLAELAKRLRPLERSEPAFENPPRGAERRGVHWVEPRLVAQIAFVERTRDGLIRHASFHGLRDDKGSDDVKLERAEPKASARAEPKRARALEAPAARGKRRATEQPEKLELDLSRIEITHPDRILYPDQGLTKRDLLLHYARVARWMLPHVSERPLMLVRCPEGEGGQCFHQKHPSRGMPKAVQQVMVQQKKGAEANLMIRDVEGLLGLVQMGALEIHTWGCRADSLECPDQLVFDLDPDEGLAWQRVVEAAHALRDRLHALGLTAFLKWTGGKGLHLVTPIEPSTPWDEAKAFSKRVADALVKDEPARYIATMTKQKRKGKIFIDYLRNGAGATSVCVYSTRSRPGAPVALPLAWDELERQLKPGAFNVTNLAQHMAQLERDPWADFDAARVALPG